MNERRREERQKVGKEGRRRRGIKSMNEVEKQINIKLQKHKQTWGGNKHKNENTNCLITPKTKTIAQKNGIKREYQNTSNKKINK